MSAYHTGWCVTWLVTPSFFGTHGSFATRTCFSLSLIHPLPSLPHPPIFFPPSSTYFSLSLIYPLLSPLSIYFPLSLIHPYPRPLRNTGQFTISSLFSSFTPISGHSGILGGLTTLEHRVVNESFSILIPTLAGGHLGTQGDCSSYPTLISSLAEGYWGTLGGLQWEWRWEQNRSCNHPIFQSDQTTQFY